MLGACSVSQPWLARVFEPQPPLRPSVREPRRLPYHPPAIHVAVVDAEPPKPDWAALYAALPRDDSGEPSWVRAIDDGAIRPAPGTGAGDEEQPVLELDVELVPKEMPEMKVTYPHAIHTKLLACDSCHPAIFQMEAGADPMTMEQIFAGEYCGRCHGKVAFDPLTGCPRCHRGLAQ